jgi:hypothetical protein
LAAGVIAAVVAATAPVAWGDSSHEPRRTPEQLRAEFAVWIKEQGGHMGGVALADCQQVRGVSVPAQDRAPTRPGRKNNGATVGRRL